MPVLKTLKQEGGDCEIQNLIGKEKPTKKGLYQSCLFSEEVSSDAFFPCFK